MVMLVISVHPHFPTLTMKPPCILRGWAGGNEIPRLIAGVWVSATVAAQALVIQVDVLFQINFKLFICIQFIRCTQAV
jgi:hypothetical protein